METNTDRQKKLEAGKEKLAAFRKKKTRKKEQGAAESKKSCAHDVENIVSETQAITQKLSDVKDVQSAFDSDQFTDTSGDEWSSEENEAGSTVFFEAKQGRSDLEGIVEGKLALGATMIEVEPARVQNAFSLQGTEGSETTEIESALAQRDALLSQLSASLFETLGSTEKNSNFEVQMSSLAQNVFQLQSQLHMADQALQDQLELHGSSAKALQEARSQMLQLQDIIVHKDREMNALLQEKEHIHKQHTDQQFQLSWTKIESELKSVKDVLLEKEQELISKEQLWTSREQEWATREHGWILRDQERAAREETLQASIEVQSSKITSLLNTEETLKTEHEGLRANYALLESQLEKLQSEQNKLTGLESELDQLRQEHNSDMMRIEVLNQAKVDLENVVSRQGQEHSDLSASYTECLSKLSDLELAKASLEEQLRTLQSSVADTDSLRTELHQLRMSYKEEAEKQIQSQNQIVELENNYFFTTDALNNKINELQNILHKTEAALLNATKSADAEKLLASSLKESIQSKDNKVHTQDLQLAELESSLRSLESNNKEIEAALSAKEDVVKDLMQQMQMAEHNLNCNNNLSKQIEVNEIEISNLKHQLNTSEDKLRVKEDESCQHIEKISALEGELASLNSVQNKQLIESQKHAEQTQGQVKLLESETTSLLSRVHELEKLKTMEEQAKETAETKRSELEQELELNAKDSLILLHRLQYLLRKLNQCQVEQRDLNEADVDITMSESETPFQTDCFRIFENEFQSIFSQLHSLTQVCDEQRKKISDADSVVYELEEKLKGNEEQLSYAQTELKSFHESADATRLQRESECSNIKRIEQEMASKDVALGELQSQLENTVLNWQKLQRIVQEKEIELQNTQEALEEQHRVCSTLKKTFEEEREELLSEVQVQREAFHQEKKQRDLATDELEELKGKMKDAETELNSLQKEKGSQTAVFASLFDILQREVTNLKDRSHLMEMEYCYSSEKEKEQRFETAKLFDNENENVDKESILNQDRNDISIDDHIAMLKAGNTSLETSLGEIFTSLKAQFEFYHKLLKDKNNAVDDLSHTNAQQKERVESLEVELVNMRQVCDSIIKSTNMGVDRVEGLQAVFNQKDDEITQLQNKVTKLREEIESSDHRAYDAELTLKDVVKEKDDKAAKVLELTQQQSDHEEKYKSLHTSHQEIQEELNKKEKNLVSIVEQNEAINSELTLLKQKEFEEAEKYKVLQESYLKIENGISESQGKCESLLADKIHTDSRLSDLMDKISDHEKRYDAMESAYAELQSKLVEKEDFLRSLASEKASLETEFKCLKEQNCTTDCELETQRRKMNEMQETLHISEDKLGCILKVKQTLEEELAQSKQEISASHNKVASLEACTSELKEELEVVIKEKDKAVQTASELQNAHYERKTAYEELCLKHSELVANLGNSDTVLQSLTRDKETLEKELLESKQKCADIENKHQCLEVSFLKLEADAEEKINTVEVLNQALADKKCDIAVFEEERRSLGETVTQKTSALEELQIYCNSLTEKIEHLSNTCEEKEKLLKEVEASAAKMTKKALCMSSAISSAMQDLQGKDEMLLLQAKEVSDLKSDIANLHNDIQEKDSQIQEHLQSLSNLQEQSNQYSSTLEDKDKDKVKLESEISALEHALAEKTSHLSASEEQLTAEKSSHDQTVKMLETVQMTALRMQSQLSYMSDCLQEKEATLVGTEILTNEKTDEIASLNDKFEKANLDIKELNDINETLRQEHSSTLAHLTSVQLANNALEAEIVQFKADLEGQELANTQSTVECKKLKENITQMSQTLNEKEGLLYDLRQDVEMCQKEIADIRSDVEHRDIKLSELQGEINVSKISLEKKHEEAETLKSNFDSCMAEMQVRLHEQETEIKDLRGQLAEESRNVQQGQDHLREIFEMQVNQMEEKLSKSEEQKETLERELEDTKLKASSSKELYERQFSELEINLQTANSDVIRLKDELSQAYNNHECALAGVRRLHEIQTVELEDNCLSLEKTVAEQKRQLCEIQVKFNKEKVDLEQNFEIQMSETEEKRRFSELEIDRLKRHLEEMKADHIQDKKSLEKSYESRVFELEDKYCVTMGELDRLRASLRDPSGAQHHDVLLIESRLQEVEATRRGLELRNRALDDEVLALKESLRLREEEMMVVLKDAAERHKEDTNQLSQELNTANEQLATQNKEHSSYVEKLMRDQEEQVLELRSSNNKLKEKVEALDMHMEFEEEFRDLQKRAAESELEVNQLQGKISQLLEENHSLKRQLFLQGHKVRLERTSLGVEEICPSYSPENFSETPTSTEAAYTVPEGFVHEHFKPLKPRTLERESLNIDGQEPDFVEEQVEGFQPELESEMIADASHQLNVHPISEAEPTEGFQPESPEEFVFEDQDGEVQHRLSLSGLSVGSSPSYHDSRKFNFPTALQSSQTRLEDAISSSPDTQIQDNHDTIDSKASDKTDSLESKEEEAVLKITEQELEKKIQAVRDEMEERYVTQLRRQEVDLTHEFSCKQEELQRDLEQSYNQRLQSVKYEWERKFTKALQKVRKEMERQHQSGGQITVVSPNALSSQASVSQSSSPRGAGPGGHSDNLSDASEEQVSLGETVQQLHKENQELAEVRDVLLRQIEISQARGLHSKMQHELQSMICNREAATAPETSSTSSEATTPTCTAVSPTFEENIDGFEVEGNDMQGKMITDNVADIPFVTHQEGKKEIETAPEADEALSARASEASETSSARERFLEELEDMSQPSCQDLPLEWELTNTLVAPALISSGDGGEESEPGGQHQSIWEVFDGRCVRQDCQEVRLQLYRLTKFLRDLSAQTQGDEAVPVSDLDLLLQAVVLSGESEGFFCSDVDLIENSSEMVINPKPITKITQHIGKNGKETLENSGALKQNLNLSTKSDEGNEPHPSIMIEEKLSAEVALLKSEKEELKNECAKLNSQLVAANQGHDTQPEQSSNMTEMLTSELGPMGSNQGDTNQGKFKGKVNHNISALNVVSGSEDSNPTISDKNLRRHVATQVDLFKGESKGDMNPSDERIIHHLQVMLVEKESANALYQEEILWLRSELKSQIKLDEHRESVINIEAETGKDAENRFIPSESDPDLDRRQVNSAERLDNTDLNVSLNDSQFEFSGNCTHESLSSGQYKTALESNISLHNSGSSSKFIDEDNQAINKSCPILNIDSLFEDESSEQSGQGTPLGLQDKQLAAEINQLRRDMKETKAIYSRENELFQEALHKDSRVKDFVKNKSDAEYGVRMSFTDRSDILSTSPRNTRESTATHEVEIAKHRLAICLEQNRMLERENTSLRARLREQEATVIQLKVDLERKDKDCQQWRNSFTSQINALQSQRNDLVYLMRDLDSSDKDSQSQREVLGATRTLQEDLMERLEELEHLHCMLSQRQVELQHCEAERRHLEQLCLLKDLGEMQLSRQKRLMEEQLSELEQRLRERESVLVEEKGKLLAELRNKDISISQSEEANRLSSVSLKDFILSPRESTPIRSYSASVRDSPIPCSQEDAERQHLEAIERLRLKLRLEYKIRSARINESEAAAVASFQERQLKK